jgi:hypothetical protein
VLFENDGDANGMEETELEVPSDRVPTPNRLIHLFLDFTCTLLFCFPVGFPVFRPNETRLRLESTVRNWNSQF